MTDGQPRARALCIVDHQSRRRLRIDWSAIVFDLERAGWSQREIGRECDMPDTAAAPWVNRLKNIPGTQPKFHSGALLLGLWAEAMGRDPRCAPTTSQLSAAGVG